MGAGASAGGDGQLLPPTKNPAAIPIFSGLEELQAKLVEKGSWTEGDRDEIGELLAAARVFYDLQIEGAKRVQAQLAEVSFYPQMLVLEKYPRDTPGKRADMHGSTWQPPLRLDVQGNPTF